MGGDAATSTICLRHARPYCLPASRARYSILPSRKWDGTGYPRGLKGEQIPYPARLFAVVDVWDALSSDRPYRQRWPERKVLEYIKQQTGKHFDPSVVETFLKLIDAKNNL